MVLRQNCCHLLLDPLVNGWKLSRRNSVPQRCMNCALSTRALSVRPKGQQMHGRAGAHIVENSGWVRELSPERSSGRRACHKLDWLRTCAGLL